MQAVCDSNLKFTNIVARWPGSAHDSTIFSNSRLMAQFENNNFPNCILLGDSGYPVKSYLMTPLIQPRTRGEHLYNEAQTRTRNCVERSYGVWKKRFPAMAYGLRLKLQTSLSAIVATAVLNNIAIINREDVPPIELNRDNLNYLIEMQRVPNPPDMGVDDIGARAFRNEIIQYFQNLN